MSPKTSLLVFHWQGLCKLLKRGIIHKSSSKSTHHVKAHANQPQGRSYQDQLGQKPQKRVQPKTPGHWLPPQESNSATKTKIEIMSMIIFIAIGLALVIALGSSGGGNQYPYYPPQGYFVPPTFGYISHQPMYPAHQPNYPFDHLVYAIIIVQCHRQITSL
jgi:hypothetical protein